MVVDIFIMYGTVAIKKYMVLQDMSNAWFPE